MEGVKRKGNSELKKVSDFFKLREKFVNLMDSVSKGIDDTNKMMTKIETFGQSVINVIKKPCAWQKKIYQKIENKLSNIIKKIEKLDSVTEEENKHVGQKNELEEAADILEYSEDLKDDVLQNSNTEDRINLGEKLQDESVRDLVQDELRFAVSKSDDYKNLLHVMSRFHKYSFNNLVLIRLQMPEAILLAGRSAWHKEYGRHVNEGENGIKILAPIIERDENNIERFDGRYRVVEIFDVSQTSGKQISEQLNNILTYNVDLFDEYLTAIENAASVPILFKNISGSEKGYYDSTENKIIIKNGMSYGQTIKEAVYQMAKMSFYDKDSGSIAASDVEINSMAFVICSHFRIDASDLLSEDIAGWESEAEITECLKRVHSKSSSIIEAIEDNLNKSKELKEADGPVYYQFYSGKTR